VIARARLTDRTPESVTEEARTSFLGRYPRSLLPGRIVPHVARVAAREVGNPIAVLILMKPDNGLLGQLYVNSCSIS
jgi:hypothetical protein